ncbi:stage II sporulation protein R [Alloiococcus sp. CFN-8]|uniref:stage II sporulation protein R n=1 Tax=Alloiococcus sp. CFN-8 TaxID=3416081 RepID=UPI003CF587B8
MKKNLVLIICTSAIFLSLLLGGCVIGEKSDSDEGELAENLSGKLIRFHVLANSDSQEDQELKQRVKDKIIEYLLPKLEEAESIEESREILIRENAAVIELAEEFIRSSGYSYTAKGELVLDNFPAKRYGAVELPQGEYEAYKIVIGSGNGQNWWCVMFPPLCFVDITMGEVEEEKTLKTMEEYLTPEEYEGIKKAASSGGAKKEEATYRFILVDLLKDIFK